MSRFSNQIRSQMVILFPGYKMKMDGASSHRVALEVVDRIYDKFGQRVRYHTVIDTFNRFETTYTIEDRKRGAKKTPEDQKKAVIDLAESNPTASTSFLGQQLDLSRETCRKILRRDGIKFYKPQKVQKLFPDDLHRRFYFCMAIRSKMRLDDKFQYKICFTDECWFHLGNFGNHQNTRYMMREKPSHFHVEYQQRPARLNAFAVMTVERIFGLYFIETAAGTPASRQQILKRATSIIMAVSLTKYRSVRDPDDPLAGHTNPAFVVGNTNDDTINDDNHIRICVESPNLSNNNDSLELSPLSNEPQQRPQQQVVSTTANSDNSTTTTTSVSHQRHRAPQQQRQRQQQQQQHQHQQLSPGSQDSGVTCEQQQVIVFGTSSSPESSSQCSPAASSRSLSAASSKLSSTSKSSTLSSAFLHRHGPALESVTDDIDPSSYSPIARQARHLDNNTQQQQSLTPFGSGVELKSHKQHALLSNNNNNEQSTTANSNSGRGSVITSATDDQSTTNGGHFEIRWSNLNYQVEPKWYAKLTGGSSNNTTTQQSSISNTTFSAQHNKQQQATNSNNKLILNNLNGSVKSGQVTAILGPSGAGKTSLLGCLTGKNKAGVSGTIQVIGGAQNKPLAVCTIPQKVRENLWFASRLKNPEDGFDHDSNIQRVLDLLKLQTCVDTRISKISGGQYKRVSIAQELLSNPDILILDEPTSGLDSLTCYRTVMVLRDLAELSPNPMAIIVTIHQPQREVYDLFHHVYILAVGGQAIYEGSPANSIKTINECSGGHLQYDASQYNPASYFVEIASAEFGAKPIECLVENQLREFRARTQALDNQWLLMAAEGHTPPSSGQLARKSRNSPMLARFKSSLGLSVDPSSNSHNHGVLVGLADNVMAASNLTLTPDSIGSGSGKKQQYQVSRIDLSGASSGASSTSSTSNNLGDFFIDKRLQAHKHNHNGHFLRHSHLLTKRSWLCLCKDPMLTTLRFSAHIIVPLLITLVYGDRIGKPNGCPLYESDIDLIKYAKIGADSMIEKQDELRTCFENVGLYFLSVYAFTFSTMCLTSLSFPLNMHVLLKEVRNGWYSIPTYFIGKSLADFPLEFILPVVTLMITYPLTGQPSSYLEWRFITATLVFVITSLIAQTQGLIFGALFMNAMQAAVFVAPVSTTPLILLSGFLIRIYQMPKYLQIMSLFSYFRYAIESLAIIRYGFGICDCDPTVVTGKPVTSSGVPDQLRTMTNYWLSTFESPTAGSLEVGGGEDFDANGALNYTALETTTVAATGGLNGSAPPVDFFQDLTNLLARANSFGYNITTCEDYKPIAMYDFRLEDNQLFVWLGALVATLVFFKIVNYYVVKYSVKFRL
ncbi:ATP-binding cassette sub-family G member 1, partial [Fragariocoptes setiger]